MPLFGLREKDFKMIWEVEGNGQKSLLAGTAHFFPYSFNKSLTKCISMAETVLLEGPLDESDMNVVRGYGFANAETQSLYEALDRETIKRINKELVCSSATSGDSFASYIDLFQSSARDVLYTEIEGVKPWMAFFKIWSHCLRKRGWKYSVDLEALNVARQLKKSVHFLETIDEQIAALNGIPFERIVDFFREIESWGKFAKKHAKHYLSGDLEALLGVTTKFPTRCESIVDRRDPVLFERMKPFVEKGNSIIFVGTTHIEGLKRMLEASGYEVSKRKV
jgi:uncharacterized protein YbaP (TraB family)